LILDHTENIVSQKNNFDVLDLLNLFVNMKIILVTTEKIDEPPIGVVAPSPVTTTRRWADIFLSCQNN